MSAIEKRCRLSLAIDRVVRLGVARLAEEIDNPKIRKGIELLREGAIETIGWDQFIEQEAKWWVDLREEYEKYFVDKFQMSYPECRVCAAQAERRTTLDGSDVYFCLRCYKRWHSYFDKILEEVYEKNLSKYLKLKE